MVSVRDLMSREVVTIEGCKTALQAAQLMRDKKVGCLIVTNGTNPIGIITAKDFVTKVASVNKSPEEVSVDSIASRPLITVNEDAPLREAVKLMNENAINRVGVTREGKIIGILSLSDIGKFVV